MEGMTSTKRCVFCDVAGKRTKEHVIPLWLGSLLYRAQPPTGDSSTGKRFTHRFNPGRDDASSPREWSTDRRQARVDSSGHGQEDRAFLDRAEDGRKLELQDGPALSALACRERTSDPARPVPRALPASAPARGNPCLAWSRQRQQRRKGDVDGGQHGERPA